jgi:TPR repeat protein
LRLDSEEIAILVKRGNDFLANGDFAAARLLLRRAAEAGSAEGAFALGTTFDPVVLQRLGAIGATPDLAEARQWYQRAAELGSSAASQQLAGLADVR